MWWAVVSVVSGSRVVSGSCVVGSSQCGEW